MDIPSLWYTLKGFGSDVAIHNIPFILSHSAQWVHVCTGGLWWCTRVCVLNLSGYWSMKTPYIFSGIFSQFGVFICHFYGGKILTWFISGDFEVYGWLLSSCTSLIFFSCFLVSLENGEGSVCPDVDHIEMQNTTMTCCILLQKLETFFKRKFNNKKKTNLQIWHLAEFFFLLFVVKDVC